MNNTLSTTPDRASVADAVPFEVIAREYTLLRDRIEAVTALATAARRSVEALDLEVADSMTLEAKVGVVDRAWTSLMHAIDQLDT